VCGKPGGTPILPSFLAKGKVAGCPISRSWELGLHGFLESGAAFSFHQADRHSVDAGQAPFAFGTQPIEHLRRSPGGKKAKIAPGRGSWHAAFAR